MHSLKLKPEILEYLRKNLNKTPGAVRNDISKARQKIHSLTINAAAQIVAEQHGLSVRKFLSKEDKLSIPSNIEFNKRPTKLDKKIIRKPKKRIVEYIKYDTDDSFIEGHVNEINRAYTYKCYTSASVISRKLVENLIIDILRKKYRPGGKASQTKYWDFANRRYLDFSIVLDNLNKNQIDFKVECHQPIKRLYALCSHLRKTINDHTHSLYYLIKKPDELNDYQIQDVLDLIKRIIELEYE